jgi:hypothetical protein
MSIVLEIIEEAVFAPEVQIQPGTENVGYILFEQVRGEKDVDATFTLPVHNDKGEMVHEFEFTFPI